MIGRTSERLRGRKSQGGLLKRRPCREARFVIPCGHERAWPHEERRDLVVLKCRGNGAQRVIQENSAGSLLFFFFVKYLVTVRVCTPSKITY